MISNLNNSKKSRFKIIVAMLIWGTLGIFVKEIKLSSIEIAFYRSIIGCIFIIFLSLLKKEKQNLDNIKENIKILIFSGISLGLGWVLLFQGYKNTTIANSTLSYYVAPIFIAILSSIVFKEKATLKKTLCILGAMIGLILIVNTKDTNSTDYNHMVGIMYSVCAAIFYAIVVILNKFIKNLPSTIVTIIQLFFSALVLLPMVYFNTRFNLSNLDIKSLILLIIVGILHTGLAYLLYFTAIKDVEGQSIAILSYIDPIFAVILSGLLLNERLTLIQILGGILILGSAFISEYGKKASNKN